MEYILKSPELNKYTKDPKCIMIKEETKRTESWTQRSLYKPHRTNCGNQAILGHILQIA